MAFFARSIRLVTVGALFWTGLFGTVSAGAVECVASDGFPDTGSAASREEYSVKVVDTRANCSREVSFYGKGDRDAALAKCKQLASVHHCTKVGSNRIGIYGYGEHIKEYQEVDLFGHTLQNPFAQFFRYSWSKIEDCNRDLVGSIAAQLR
jgi:hypothetical protein